MLLEAPYEYNASLVRVIDGDTLVLKIDLGFKVEIEQTVRLYGIDAPEVIGETREAGLAAKNAVVSMLTHESAKAEKLLIRTHKSAKKDKYGRYVAEITFVNTDGNTLSLNEQLITRGFAVPYIV
jgi:endonuclease YncB( thermonuclease family)